MEKYKAIKERSDRYKNILNQVIQFRENWDSELREFIVENTEHILESIEIDGNIKIEERFENLESVSILLGKYESGIQENFEMGTQRQIIKDMGSLNFSQLFNGKVQAWMTFPLIEGIMQPQQPFILGIYAPPEFDIDLILSCFDQFFKQLIEWENYDDDQPNAEVKKIGFGATSIPKK